ncbi:MAG: RecQ family ATP-dependent DNA helicase [Candidatus Brocadiales bacterium]|nr:RecQ family ATP-dependent DNA helicase [Candidatus Brocadiales bacterium]
MEKSIKDQAVALLRNSLGNKEANFHEHQWESISTLVENRGRLLVVQRTGWGKSAVYFIATQLLRTQGYGPTIIISPLLALMRNQIDSAEKYGVKLGTINSSNTNNENNQTILNIQNENLDAIIISPEQLSKPSFNDDVLRPMANRVGLFVIDEAHCISDWGHDFRPDYKRIANILPFLPKNMPVLATTATANERVMTDVCSQLGDNIQVYRGNLTRESLHLQNIAFPKRSQRLAWLADTLPQLDGTGIIYTATTRDADQVSDWLKNRGIAVEAYYGKLKGLNKDENRKRRLELEDSLLKNKLKALVATSALGMGYDKPDLSFVIHYQSPGSVVRYYQEVGRAGRAIPKAYGILLSGNEDDDIQKYFIQQAFPQEQLVQDILAVLEISDEGLSKNEIQAKVNGRPKKIESALKFLSAESPAPIMTSQQRSIKYSRTVIDYQLPHETIARLSQIKEREWSVMQEYLHHKECLMQFLSHQLDDQSSEPCKKCVNCNQSESLSTEYSHETGLAAAEFMENILIIIEPKKRAGNGGAQVTSRFPVYQFPFNLVNNNLQHESGRALSRWGEAGWGEIAMYGKQNGHFDARLVDASAKLILNRWQPDPYPKWVTYVPSKRHPDLVPNFAVKLAGRLGLPCINAVNIIKDNSPQKRMENSDFRCKNLDGVFEIAPELPEGPLFLIDDAFDSGTTFMVISALLRRSGSGLVYPFAIMSTSTSA